MKARVATKGFYTLMARSALASGQSLMGKLGLGFGAVVLASSFSASALANSAATATTTADPFHVSSEDLKSSETALGKSDPKFRALHDSWGRIKGTKAAEVSIPSINPVESMNFSSNFGMRRAPTRGASRNHKGVDIPGPVGTPIYATADATVDRAERVRGYGKFIELNHGNAITTRYGHMSALNVYAGQRVRKGEIIGYMGSTGRSTGSHLHYEVRIAGEAVNPKAFFAASKVVEAPQPVVVATATNRLPGQPQVVTNFSSGTGK